MSSVDSGQRGVRLTSEDDHRPSSSSSETSDLWDCSDGGLDAQVVLQTGDPQQTHPVWSRKRPSSSSCDHLCEGADSENEAFFKKCLELQRYIQPLQSILQGLTSGRFTQRLGRFQEGLATDRIQRILGVLQSPEVCVRVTGPLPRIILIIEELLHSWFPHIDPELQQKENQTPAKRKKLQDSVVSSAPPPPRTSLCFSSPHICSLKTVGPAVSPPPPTSLAPPHHSQEVTQDNVVSSSTDSQRRLLPQPRHSTPCLRRLLRSDDDDDDDDDVS